jgi:hypothetical protein
MALMTMGLKPRVAKSSSDDPGGFYPSEFVLRLGPKAISQIVVAQSHPQRLTIDGDPGADLFERSLYQSHAGIRPSWLHVGPSSARRHE